MADNLKRQSFPACGRLVVLENIQKKDLLTQLNNDSRYQGFMAINFPAMPDMIELARQAEYAVSTPWGFPDGIHFYKGTSVLQIPLSFKLHAFDKEYCPQGVKSLLQIAADLQSLVLPFGQESTRLTSGYSTAPADTTPSGAQKDVKKSAAETTIDNRDIPENVYPPATCYLELIITERSSVGICCVGYVKDVRVKLMGPWMRGPGISQNLPTNGEFEFTFIHHPGHTNAYNPNHYDNRGEQQAYAKVVQQNLYNTVNLMSESPTFKGFND